MHSTLKIFQVLSISIMINRELTHAILNIGSGCSEDGNSSGRAQTQQGISPALRMNSAQARFGEILGT
ncbi:hypothetical protein BDW69DRAFT_163062 [Aspergillus filifer]